MPRGEKRGVCYDDAQMITMFCRYVLRVLPLRVLPVADAMREQCAFARSVLSLAS